MLRTLTRVRFVMMAVITFGILLTVIGSPISHVGYYLKGAVMFGLLSETGVRAHKLTFRSALSARVRIMQDALCEHGATVFWKATQLLFSI